MVQWVFSFTLLTRIDRSCFEAFVRPRIPALVEGWNKKREIAQVKQNNVTELDLEFTLGKDTPKHSAALKHFEHLGIRSSTPISMTNRRRKTRL